MLLPECLNAKVTELSKSLLLSKEAEQQSEQWQIYILIKKVLLHDKKVKRGMCENQSQH